MEQTRVDLVGGGYVELVHSCPEIYDKNVGADSIVTSAARISFNNYDEEKTPGDNQRLIDYLYRNGHTSPFEMGTLTFVVYAPKFVTIQLLRHRTFRFNEESQRYHKIDNGFFHPSDDPERFIRTQSSKNKQGSEVNETLSSELVGKVKTIETKLEEIETLYHELIDDGVARECARFCLPISTWSHIVVQCDLNNLTKFLKLRLDDHAQYEIRLVARAMYKLAKEVFPMTMNSFDKHSLTNITDLDDGLITQ